VIRSTSRHTIHRQYTHNSTPEITADMPIFASPLLADFAITAHGFNGNPPQPLPRQISTHLSDLDGRLDVPQVTIPGDGADDHRMVSGIVDHIIPQSTSTSSPSSRTTRSRGHPPIISPGIDLTR
jgi:hypothetical protein